MLFSGTLDTLRAQTASGVFWWPQNRHVGPEAENSVPADLRALEYRAKSAGRRNGHRCSTPKRARAELPRQERLRMTHDELIAASIWSGPALEFRNRMAEYLVDGSRFGAMEMRTRSGSPNDVHLDKRTSEITKACMLFSYLKVEGVQIRSLDANGKPLERPDLDAKLPDGAVIGVEIADVSETRLRKHESGRNLIETTIGDLLDRDPAFRAAMGNVYFALTLNAIGPYGSHDIASKKEAQAIASEIVTFVKSGDHMKLAEDYFSTFSSAYPTLHARGAQSHVDAWEHEAHFTVSEGASTIGTVDRRHEVVRVLDDHRKSASEGYRRLPTWIVLFLTDTLEYFYNTIASVERDRPRIEPFERGFLMDSAGRLLRLE
jgi:hypothetical protein